MTLATLAVLDGTEFGDGARWVACILLAVGVLAQSGGMFLHLASASRARGRGRILHHRQSGRAARGDAHHRVRRDHHLKSPPNRAPAPAARAPPSTSWISATETSASSPPASAAGMASSTTPLRFRRVRVDPLHARLAGRAHLADVRLTVVRQPHESDQASSDRLAQEAYEPPRTSASIFPPTCPWSGSTTTRSPDACARR
jgi:hypothetical protein